ncbi:response regulator, partial [Candidatus Neomarinimicrobiota bacterium]
STTPKMVAASMRLNLAEQLRDTLTKTEVFITPLEISIGMVHLDEFRDSDDIGVKLVARFSRLAGMRAGIARKRGKNQICAKSALDEYKQVSGRIMVIDTDELNVDVLKTALEGLEFEVQSCSDGQQALDSIALSPPDLIIAELMVPKLDGLAVRQQMVDMALGSTVPYILMSHQKNEDLVNRALSLDIEHVIKKPYLLSEVVGIIRHKLAAAHLG